MSGTSGLFQIIGSLISTDGYCEKEICCRIEIAIFQDKKKLFTSKLNLELESECSNLMFTLVVSTLCSREIRTLTKADKDEKPLKCGSGEE